MTEELMISKLFDFLQGEELVITLEGIGELDRQAAQAKLRELIPATIEVKQVCKHSAAIVIAAPHVRFDGWSEHFTRLAAKENSTGRVIACNFRDENQYDIPVSIGRHIHVNRPTESAMLHGREIETTRAREAFEQYVKAVSQAGSSNLPIDLLIEFHGHRRNDTIEIATVGVEKELAEAMLEVYHDSHTGNDVLPELRIEPIHRLHFSAVRAKRDGVMRAEIARQAVHIELPRSLRRPEPNRIRTWKLLRPLIGFIVEQHTSAYQ